MPDKILKLVTFSWRSQLKAFIRNLKQLFLGLLGIICVLITVLFSGLVIYAIYYVVSWVMWNLRIFDLLAR
jgi:uncharacterized membrane-anchored protein